MQAFFYIFFKFYIFITSTICGLKIGDTNYTVRITIEVKGNKKYYDQSLAKIEKGLLVDNIDKLNTCYTEKAKVSYAMFQAG